MATERGALAQVIHTGVGGLDAGTVEIPTSDGAIPAYYARPEGDRIVPVVVVIEEIFGVHEYIRDVCRRLANEGYLAIAPELYARSGVDLSKMTDAQQIVRDVISKTPDDRAMLDLDSAAAWATTRAGDPGRIAVTGFCRGGRDTWLFAAHSPAPKAAVAWYGPLGGGTTPIQPAHAARIGGRSALPPARPLRRAGPEQQPGADQGGGGPGEGGGAGGGVRGVSRCTTWVSCGLPAELSGGGCTGWVGADAGVVQAVWSLSAATPTSSRVVIHRTGDPAFPRGMGEHSDFIRRSIRLIVARRSNPQSTRSHSVREADHSRRNHRSAGLRQGHA